MLYAFQVLLCILELFLLDDYILASIILFAGKFVLIIQNNMHKVPAFILSCIVWYISLFLGLFLTSKKWMQPITWRQPSSKCHCHRPGWVMMPNRPTRIAHECRTASMLSPNAFCSSFISLLNVNIGGCVILCFIHNKYVIQAGLCLIILLFTTIFNMI